MIAIQIVPAYIVKNFLHMIVIIMPTGADADLHGGLG